MEEEDDLTSGEPVVVPIEEHLDLHAFSPREVKAVVEEYLLQCRARGLLEVRVIHGRGSGTQRAVVRSLLARNSGVIRFADAPAEAGGWGATIVHLKPAGPPDP